MNELIKINDTSLEIKEYNGKRVLTFKDVDMVHNRPDGTARKRFNDNKKHFIEGEDYFKIPYNENPIGGRSIFDIPNEIECYRGRDYSGFIYIAKDVNNGYWKVGRTSSQKTAEKRLNLSRTSNLENYQYFDCVDTLRADKEIQNRLNPYKVKNSWYDCDVNIIVEEIKTVISEVTATHEPRKKHKGGFHGNITFVTESGYLMLVKSFTDELAWSVQRQLVKSYFRLQQVQKVVDSYTIDDPIKRAERWIEEQKEKLQLLTTVAVQEQQISEMKPKASYYDVVLNCPDLMSTSSIAKDYGKSARWLNAYLHDKGVQYRQGNIWLLYQKYAQYGYTNTKTHTVSGTDGTQHAKVHTYWTQKGRLFIYDLLKSDNVLPIVEQNAA